MTDFITQNDDENKKGGFFSKAKEFIFPKSKNQITLISEEEFNNTLMQDNVGENVGGKRKLPVNSQSIEKQSVKERASVRAKKFASPSTHTITIHSGNIELHKKRLPLIGNLPIRTQYLLSFFLMALALCTIVLAFITYSASQYKGNVLQNNITTLVTELQTLSSVLNRSLSDDKDATEVINKQIDNVDRRIKIINSVASDLGVADNAVIVQMAIDKNWSNTLSNLRAIGGTTVIDNKSIGLYIGYLNNMSTLLGKNKNNPDVASLSNIIDRLKGNLSNLIKSPDASTLSAIKADEESIKESLLAVRWSTGVNKLEMPIFEKLGMTWVVAYPVLQDILNQSLVSDSKNRVNSISESISTMSNQINNGLLRYPYMKTDDAKIAQAVFVVCALLIILSFITIINIYLYEKVNDALIDKLENEHNQNAILSMLEEMGPLIEGDLTKKITVSDDLTSAIADATNRLSEDFNKIVSQIKQTSIIMGEKTKNVNEMSALMYQEGERQAAQINDTGQAVLQVTDLISRVSSKAHKGEGVANQTLKASEEGTSSVKESILTMASIKTNMAETVRLMVRLNAVSDQISSIVELLSDITEETRVLSLSATVQASKAGEAGKGFKIVADSVGLLSNKATDATRKVATLINATKTDIQEIIGSVEKTNIEIEKGTQLSEKAGTAFERIKSVSNELTEVMKDISKDTHKHVNMSNDITIEMKGILENTKHTMKSNEKIVESMSEMTKIADNLDKSVKYFKVD